MNGDKTVFSDVCFDFDGVLHSYISGWQGPTIIPDPPVTGAIAYLHNLHMLGITMAVHSCRSHQKGGIIAMQNWLCSATCDLFRRKDTAESLIRYILWPKNKPGSKLYIDDRGFCFMGTFPSVEFIRNFQPWHGRPV